MDHSARNQDAKMPSPQEYDEEISMWPWKKLIEIAAYKVAEIAPNGSVILDYMCGTGLLFRRLATLRPDLKLIGCDKSVSYVNYAQRMLPSAEFKHANVLTWTPWHTPDVVIATAGVHHLHPRDQPVFFQKVHAELQDNGTFLLGEELLQSWQCPHSRLDSIRGLYCDIFSHLLQQQASRSVLESSLDVFVNDILQRGEFKLSVSQLERLLFEYFEIQDKDWTWRTSNEFAGDCLFTCRKRRSLRS